ncbi:MAG: hypothetical protein CMJ83_19620 [Planctomycetes bacterium]|nr:hypothetical protein [Planctomycetota bacterium]
MTFRSIRWTLSFWYAVIIIGSLAALGWTLLAEMERKLYEDADEQLEYWLWMARLETSKASTSDLQQRLAASLPRGATFGVWNGEGQRQTSADADLATPRHEGAETRGHIRVRTKRLDGGWWILVGMNVEDEHHRVRDFLYLLLLTGAGIVVVALGGGWLLVTRALAPVAHIGATARRISGENLGARISTKGIKNELADLAHTLNASFDRLEAEVERQARFTADASHELRTPLAVVLAHLELADTRDKTEEQLRERVAICHEASLRMRSVVEGLLTLARADAGELKLDQSDVDLHALLEDVRTSIGPLAAERDVTVEHRLDPVTVPGDAERLREAITNLYTNAVRHSDDGGKVTITLERDNDVAVVRVADTGPGIPAEHLPRIFERFYRVDVARTRGDGGSGLGLSITRRIIELHRGVVSVASSEGEGAEFTVRLPAV